MKNRQPTEAELIGRLHREMGATVALDIRDVPSPNPLLGSRRRVNASLLRGHPDAEPYEWADKPATLTLIWPSLPKDSDRIAVRRAATANAGIWPEHVNHLWLVPHVMDRQPWPLTIAEYLPWLMEALWVTDTRWVVLLGSRPVWTWRPDLKPKDVYGKVGVWRDRWYVYPMDHPNNVDRRSADQWNYQWLQLGKLMKHDHLVSTLNEHCISCGNPLYMYDGDGIAWCQTHTQDGLKSQRKASEQWAQLSINATQLGLLPPGDS